MTDEVNQLPPSPREDPTEESLAWYGPSDHVEDPEMDANSPLEKESRFYSFGAFFSGRTTSGSGAMSCKLSYEFDQCLGFDRHPWPIINVVTQLYRPFKESSRCVGSLKNLF